MTITGMGLAYESRVSVARAMSLAPTGRPQMGYEVTVATAPDGHGGFFRLWLQNCSGTFVLACAQVTKDRWGNVFGVEP
ncbi:hypothetical protein [Cupriavidus sp. RAF12]|uniref:hypothetical protein n=1 Tax=Cupriavidus sp. RAF12 TaxID=3233050 RepID=UPI003F91CCA9